MLEDDESYIVWQSITDALEELAHVYQSDRDLHDHITGFARKTYAKIFAKLGWENSPKDGASTSINFDFYLSFFSLSYAVEKEIN